MTHKKRDEPSFNTKTNKKNKTSNKTANKGLGFEIEKWGLLTPRTMAESRLNKGKNPRLNQSKLKIERFLWQKNVINSLILFLFTTSMNQS